MVAGTAAMLAVAPALLGGSAPALALAPSAAFALWPHAGPAVAALPPVQVAPGRGGPRTTFTISFRASIDTTVDPYNESYEMDVKGPAHSGCTRDEGVYTSSGRAIRRGQLVHVRVSAPYRHARWCAGIYTGSIHEVSVNPSSTCEQEQGLPGCATGETLVGTFRFRAVR
jgi:hypothetical protein